MDAGRKLGLGLAGGVLGGSSTVGDAGCLFKLWVLRDRRKLATNRGSRSKGDFFFFVSRWGCRCLLGLLGVDVRTRLLRNVTSAWRTSICGKRYSLQWCHNEHDGVSNHQPHDCLLNPLFRCRSKKTSKLHVAGLCVGNSPVTGEFPAQRASNAENVSIWWRQHGEPCSLNCQRELQSTLKWSKRLPYYQNNSWTFQFHYMSSRVTSC